MIQYRFGIAAADMEAYLGERWICDEGVRIGFIL